MSRPLFWANGQQGPYRLVVRTSRCGRDNPGSTPGEDLIGRALLELVGWGGVGWGGVGWGGVSFFAFRSPKKARKAVKCTNQLWAHDGCCGLVVAIVLAGCCPLLLEKNKCACWESNPGHKHGRLVRCRYATCALNVAHAVFSIVFAVMCCCAAVVVGLVLWERRCGSGHAVPQTFGRPFVQMFRCAVDLSVV